MKRPNLFAWAALVMVFACAEVAAQQFTVLYKFKGTPDGANPQGSLIRNKYGTLFGTTYSGGTTNRGTIFKLGGGGIESVVHSFSDDADGMHPTAGLVGDGEGNLYGTTPEGGIEFSFGTLFKVDQNGNHTVLIKFGASEIGGWPNARMIRDAAGKLYGTTYIGGNLFCPVEGCGVVFMIDEFDQETVLYSFVGPYNGTDGWNPNDLLLDGVGNLYGTTVLVGLGDGGHGYGTIFKLDSSGQETVLYRFTGGADGANPHAGVVRDQAGNLYGSTYAGGKYGYGVIFKLSATGALSVLHHFTGGWDGANPHGGLIWGNGKLYGTTVNGGGYGFGVVFSLDKPNKLKILHSFTGGSDGAYPYAGLLGGAGGMMWGTASAGGSTGGVCGTVGCGTVFRMIF